MPSLTTDTRGFIRFAAISDTWLGSRSARSADLAWFYQSLPGLGVSTVLHLGGALGDATAEFDYPQVEGVTTLELSTTLQPLAWPRLRARGRDDVSMCDGFFTLVHGAHSTLSARMALIYSPGVDLRARVRERELDVGLGREPPAIILIGGNRKPQLRYYHYGRACIGTVGVFAAPTHYKNPPPPYGGTIVEVKLNDDASLDTCVLKFRDMSGRMTDTPKEVTDGRRTATAA